jgi:hypothetical protein
VSRQTDEEEWPDEPEEFDPDSLGPETPTAEDLIPATPSDDVDVDPAVERLFWWLVLVFNAALLALSLGVMFVLFQGQYAFGGQLTLVGVVLFAYGYYRYRNRPKSDDDESDDDSDTDDGTEDTG